MQELGADESPLEAVTTRRPEPSLFEAEWKFRRRPGPENRDLRPRFRPVERIEECAGVRRDSARAGREDPRIESDPQKERPLPRTLATRCASNSEATDLTSCLAAAN